MYLVKLSTLAVGSDSNVGNISFSLKMNILLRFLQAFPPFSPVTNWFYGQSLHLLISPDSLSTPTTPSIDAQSGASFPPVYFSL